MSDVAVPAPEGKYMVDTYENWARAEGVPVHEGVTLDLAALATEPWARMGVNGAMCHLTGRCDYLTMWLLDIPANGATVPQRHMFQAVFTVISGTGTASVETSDGVRHSFEWGPRSVFAVPINARYSLSASAAARVAAISDFRYMLNLFRNERFLFANPAQLGTSDDFKIATAAVSRADAAVLETNLVADAARCAIPAGARALTILPPDGILGIDVWKIPGGATGAAQKLLPGTFIFPLTGSGHTRHWIDGESEIGQVDWRPGMVFAPGLQVVHQHVNTGSAPARLLGVQYGSLRYPMARDKAVNFTATMGAFVKA